LAGYAPIRLKEIVRPYYLRSVYFKMFPQWRPREFSECWEYPSFPLNADVLASQLPPQSSHALLFFPMTDLHSRVQRTQQLAMAFAARGHSCFLLNPHLGRQCPQLYRKDPDPKFGVLGQHLAELHVRLPAEPVYHSRLLDPAESTMLADGITPVASFAKGGVQQIVTLPTWLDAAIELRRRFGWPIIYDCHDWIGGFRGISPDIVAVESRAFEAADLVLFSSERLSDLHQSRHPLLKTKSRILRNAADPAHFAGVPTIRDRRGNAPRTIGYFGALDEWFDIEAVRDSAQRFSDRKFQLIGRVEHARLRSLTSLRNVELVGEVPYDELPEFVAGFQIAMIPFRVNPLTVATNPIKLYEYFSCGLPVVSSRLPEVEFFGDLVYLADRTEDFPERIAWALAESGGDKPARRIAATRRETWAERASEIAGALAGLY
jgi:glycosyltransferase involved in cell wall biosynthesis